MIEPLPDLPEGVIGFRATGTIEPDDYQQQLIPAVDAAAKGDGIRLVFVFPEWDGFGHGAELQDLKMGFEHLKAWKRTALVTDVEWMAHWSKVFRFLTPGELEVFPLSALDDAIAWAAG